ncbi:hypothetical protein ACWEKT_39840 [Nocardia takedensis]
MDPTIMAAAAAAASAVSAGLAAGLTETAQSAVADAYQKVKAVISRNYPSVEVEVVETRPEVISRQAVLAEELAAAGADEDPQLAELVEELWRVIEENSPKVADLVGVQLRHVEADELEIRTIKAVGARGVIIENVKVRKKLSVTDVEVASELPGPR